MRPKLHFNSHIIFFSQSSHVCVCVSVWVCVCVGLSACLSGKMCAFMPSNRSMHITFVFDYLRAMRCILNNLFRLPPEDGSKAFPHRGSCATPLSQRTVASKQRALLQHITREADGVFLKLYLFDHILFSTSLLHSVSKTEVFSVALRPFGENSTTTEFD